MQGIFRTLWLTTTPALAVAGGLILAGVAAVTYLYVTRDRPQESLPPGQVTRPSAVEQRPAPTLPESQPAPQGEAPSPDTERPSPETPESASRPVPDPAAVAIQQKTDAARACLAASPPDLEAAAAHLEKAEARARAEGLVASWVDLPTARSLHAQIERHHNALREAKQSAREQFDVDTIERRLAEATQAWDHPRVAECRREIEKIVLRRIALAQSREQYEEATDLLAKLQRFSRTESHAKLPRTPAEPRPVASRPTTANGVTTKDELLGRVRSIVEKRGLRARPSARITQPVRQALDEVQACLDEAARLAPSDPEVSALRRIVSPWLEVARSVPNLLLSDVPDDVDLAGLVDLERLREWPALPDFISEWLDSPQTRGATRATATFFQRLGLRVLGGGTHACFAAYVAGNGVPLASTQPRDELAFRWTFATHVRWEKLLRALAAADALEGENVSGDAASVEQYAAWRAGAVDPATVFPEDSPTARTLRFANSLWLHQSAPGLISVGLGLGLCPASIDPAGQRTKEKAETVGSVWEVANPAARREDLWLAGRKWPAAFRNLLGPQTLELADGILLTAHNDSENIILTARLNCPTAEEAAELSATIAGAAAAFSEVPRHDSETAQIVAELLMPLSVHVNGDVVACRLTMSHAAFERLIEAIRREVLLSATAERRDP